MIGTGKAALVGCAALLLAGCGSDAGADGGPPDARTADAAIADASMPDAASPDASEAACAMDCAGVVAPTLMVPGDGLVLWLRADVGVRAALPSHRVCGWCDLSAAGNHLAARNPAQQTLWVAASSGGHPAVSWADTEALERSDTLGIAPTAGRTLAIVVRLDDAAVRSSPFYQALDGSVFLSWGLDPNTFQTVGKRFGVYMHNNAFDAASSTDLKPHVHVLTVDSMVPGGVVGKVLHYHVDGALQALTAAPGSSAANLVLDFSPANTTKLGYGGPARMTISEVLVYDRPLPDVDRQAVEQALRTRYGL